MESYLKRLREYTDVISCIPEPKYMFDEIVFNTSGVLNICLIEYRIMDEIKYVINAILRVYQPNEIGFTIVCGSINYPFIQSIVSSWKNVKIINTKDKNLTRGTYSALLKMPQFWEYFHLWSHVLIYQTDALIMRKIDPIYFNYHYIGAPWSDELPQDVKIPAGNGGFSLRNVQSMIKACESNRNILPDDICTSNEDLFFCNTKSLIFPNCNSEEHKAFSVESIYHHEPIGCHQVYRYISQEEFDAMINYIKKKLW